MEVIHSSKYILTVDEWGCQLSTLWWGRTEQQSLLKLFTCIPKGLRCSVKNDLWQVQPLYIQLLLSLNSGSRVFLCFQIQGELLILLSMKPSHSLRLFGDIHKQKINLSPHLHMLQTEESKKRGG